MTEKAGEGSGEGARWAPPQKIFEKSNLKPFILVHIFEAIIPNTAQCRSYQFYNAATTTTTARKFSDEDFYN